LKTAASTRFGDSWRRWLAGALLVLTAGTATAHKASDAYLQLDVARDGVLARWDIALRDLDAALEIDGDGDRLLTWAELRTGLPRIQAHVLAKLSIEGCPLAVQGHALERRSDGVYLALSMHAQCAPPAGLPLRYSLFADSDATHRGIANVRFPDGRMELRLLDPGAAGERAGPPGSFVLEGIHHILTGYDHLLFLLCLVLPIAVKREPGTAWRVAGVVTLFTLAHSLTLALAALGHASLPSRIVEPAIALTIVAAAIDNLKPMFGRFRSAVTFAFGLVHGFGFAGVLQELALDPSQFAWALLKFNVGIELGQLAVLAVAACVLCVMGSNPARRHAVAQAGSLAAALVALVWFVERGAAVVA
jgi:hypothetical protein